MFRFASFRRTGGQARTDTRLSPDPNVLYSHPRRSRLESSCGYVSDRGGGMRKLKRGLQFRLSRRVVAIAAVATLTVVAGTGTVLADPGGLFAGGDNLWPYNAPDTPAASAAPVLAAV